MFKPIDLQAATSREIADALSARGSREYATISVLTLCTMIERSPEGSELQAALSKVLEAVQQIGPAMYRDRIAKENSPK